MIVFVSEYITYDKINLSSCLDEHIMKGYLL